MRATVPAPRRVSLKPAATGVDAIDLYLGEIGRTSLLGEQEERQLAREARDGNEGAERELVARNLRFVVSIAKKYQHRGLHLDDLIAEGNVGLVAAADRFDPDQGVRFITYAVWWIRQAILIALMRQGRVVRVPTGRLAKHGRLSKAQSLLRNELGREPSAEEIADAAGESVLAVEDWRRLHAMQISLDATSPELSERSLGEQLAAPPREVAPEESEEYATLITTALSGLLPREAAILRDYFGLEGRSEQTLDEIARALKITRERVRQIRDRALGKLRNGPHAAALFALDR